MHDLESSLKTLTAQLMEPKYACVNQEEMI